MPADFESHTLLFDIILGGPHALVVPTYQRSYSWESEQVEELWDDLLANWSDADGKLTELDDLYFLGSIVTIPGAIGKQSLLLDGQQRLATITIMLACIRDILSTYESLDAKKISQTLHSLLIQAKGSPSATDFQLTLNKEDQAFFRAVVQESPPPTPAPRAIIRSQRRIAKTKSIIKSRLAALLKAHDRSEDQITMLDRLWKAIAGRIAVVNVTVTDEEEAGRIFEILNARGLELSLADLLRNFLISEADPNVRFDIALLWDGFIADFFGFDLSPFLRYSWISRRADVSKKKAYRAIRTAFTGENKLTPIGFLNDLTNDAKSYLELTTTQYIARKNRRLSDLIWGFNVLRAKQAIPLLLAVDQLCPEKLSLVLRQINSITFRYGIVGANPNDFESVYSSLARRLRRKELDNEAFAIELHKSLSAKFPPNELFTQRLSEWTVDRSDLQRYSLWELERVIGKHDELAILDPTSVNIEHIYPQNANPTVDEMQPLIERLGNLTFLKEAPNKAFGNSPFKKKKPAYGDSKLSITSSLVDYPEWNGNAVQKRQDWLVSFACEAWSLTV